MAEGGPDAERFVDLKPHVRFWLEGMSDDEAESLDQVNGDTLKWLAGLRQEEITEIRDGVELIRAIKRMGSLVRFGLICIGIVASAIVALDQAARAIRAYFFGH